MPTFTPPSVNDLPRYTEETPEYIKAIARYFNPLPRGRSVLREGGVYVLVDYPTVDRTLSAQEVYMGGHIYTVDEATALALIEAGFLIDYTSSRLFPALDLYPSAILTPTE